MTPITLTWIYFSDRTVRRFLQMTQKEQTRSFRMTGEKDFMVTRYCREA